MTATTPAGLVITPQDIANGVLFLASDDASVVHGITLYVDGGISPTRLAEPGLAPAQLSARGRAAAFNCCGVRQVRAERG